MIERKMRNEKDISHKGLDIPITKEFFPPVRCADDECGVVYQDLLALLDLGLGLDRDPPVLDVDRVLGVGSARVVDQTEHGEQGPGLLVPEQDGVGLEEPDGPHHILLGEVQITSLQEKVNHILLVLAPH